MLAFLLVTVKKLIFARSRKFFCAWFHFFLLKMKINKRPFQGRLFLLSSNTIFPAVARQKLPSIEKNDHDAVFVLRRRFYSLLIYSSVAAIEHRAQCYHNTEDNNQTRNLEQEYRKVHFLRKCGLFLSCRILFRLNDRGPQCFLRKMDTAIQWRGIPSESYDSPEIRVGCTGILSKSHFRVKTTDLLHWLLD